MLQVSRREREGRGDGLKKGEGDRQMEKKARTRGWLREFEESVKGFDCSEEKGTHGEKMKQKWHKMTKKKWPLTLLGRRTWEWMWWRKAEGHMEYGLGDINN